MLGDGSRSYTYDLGRIGSERGGAWGYPLSDALGSTRQLTDASAGVSTAQSFEPFGAPMKTAGESESDFGFTGEQDGIAGLVFLRSRFYDPSIGRFLTRDPFPGYSSLPSTLNPYSYAMNNPVNLVDPSGQFPFLAFAAVIFALGFAVNTWMQYQANHGWCGYDPSLALQSGVSAAVVATLVVFTGIEIFALAGMGLQGIGVLFNWLPAFSAGLKFSAAAGAAATWFMTGQPTSRPSGKSIPAGDSGNPKIMKPRNLSEKLTLEEAKAAHGDLIIKELGDEARLIANYGPGEWVKMQFVHRSKEGGNIVIHWFENLASGLRVEFKFINR